MGVWTVGAEIKFVRELCKYRNEPSVGTRELLAGLQYPFGHRDARGALWLVPNDVGEVSKKFHEKFGKISTITHTNVNIVLSILRISRCNCV